MKTIDIDVYGQQLSLRGDGDESYVQELAQYVENQMNTVAGGMAVTSPVKVAILAAINITDQLFSQEKVRQASEAEMEKRAIGMLQSIEKQLEG